MATSPVSICNKALRHIGNTKTVANLETERSAEADALNAFYDSALNEVMKKFPWPFAKKFATLALVEVEPTSEWGYSYRYPTDCLELRRILSGIRNDTEQTKVPYIVSSDDEGLLILTDKQDAKVEYTRSGIDPQRFPPDFVMALSFLIGFYVAPSLTGGDPQKLGTRAFTMYSDIISTAEASAANEESSDPLPDSEFISVRN